MNIEKQYPEIHRKVSSAMAADDRVDEAVAEYRNTMREAMLELRLKLGFTAKKFGSFCGASKAYVYSLEKGKRPWNKALYEKLVSGIARL